MRAAAASRHISGAEGIVHGETALAAHTENLLARALSHTRGGADEINLKIERISPDDIAYVPALPVCTRTAASVDAARDVLAALLEQLAIPRAREVLAQLAGTYGMRGAMVLDADTLERLEPDGERGVRVSVMDAQERAAVRRAEKNHFEEALILATKAAHAPGIVAEICVSDDPEYQTGYIASKALGYVRVFPVKDQGDERGGRILLYRGARALLPVCLDYLQKKPVLVTGLPAAPPPANLTAPPAVPAADPWDRLRAALADKKERGLYRVVPRMESVAGPVVRFQGRRLVMLASNNYLDLAGDRRLARSARKAARAYGSGSGGSRLTTGTTPPHLALERALAAWKGTEAALLFNTGYMANVGVISALCSKDSVIFSDEKNHASIIDGCRLSGARVLVYRHIDMADLEAKVRAAAPCAGLIVSDSVFSMEGDIAPLPAIAAISARFGLFSMIDEAHASGVLGETGRGLTELCGVRPDIVTGTCSKALGSEGGFVCGSALLIDYLVNHARPFIFSTALSASTAAASARALAIVQTETWRVGRLRENARFFCACLRQHGVAADTPSAIVPVVIGGEQQALAASRALLDAGFYVPAIRYPTVPKDQAMLRAVVCSGHTEKQLAAAARAIASFTGAASFTGDRGGV
jgi:6-carboxyhexanoate--CoA ligase